MSEPLWSLEGVAIHARTAVRLQDLTLHIGRGITAILGPSGAGKTSLCNLLVGFEKPHCGRLIWRPPGSGSAPLPLYWSAADGLWPHLDALGHLTAVAPAKPRRPLPELLARFALGQRAQARPGELSAGERERLGVARALASEALVLVLDEPFAHVDASAATRCWTALMDDVRAHGTSLIYSTHSADRVVGLAGNVVCLHEGRLLEHGTVDDLYHRPTTRQSADCLGEANWFSAEDQPWFPDAPVIGCVRPERLLISRDDGGHAIVRQATFHGAYAEVVASLPVHGCTRTFIHRPVDPLNAGDRVRLEVRPAPPAPQAPRAELPAAGLLVLLALAFGLAGCGEAKPLAFHEEKSWNLPPVAATQPAPRGLGRLGDDQVLVLDTAGRVMVYDGGGALVRQWTMPAYDIGRPEGVVQLPDGRIAVADTHYHRVVLFAADGTVSNLIGSEGSGPAQFLFPVGVATDPAGNLYVSEYGGNDRVQKFSPALKPLASFGGFGIQAGKFQRPQGLTWHEGKVFVADAMNNRIQVFRDDGAFVGVVGGDHPPELDLPYNLAISADGTITAVEYSGNRITRLDAAGTIIGRYGRAGAGEGQFSTPWGMTVDGHGRVWVADTGNRRLVELIP